MKYNDCKESMYIDIRVTIKKSDRHTLLILDSWKKTGKPSHDIGRENSHAKSGMKTKLLQYALAN
jgi:hypothetical protein